MHISQNANADIALEQRVEQEPLQLVKQQVTSPIDWFWITRVQGMTLWLTISPDLERDSIPVSGLLPGSTIARARHLRPKLDSTTNDLIASPIITTFLPSSGQLPRLNRLWESLTNRYEACGFLGVLFVSHGFLSNSRHRSIAVFKTCLSCESAQQEVVRLSARAELAIVA